jgi:hypothetical protein
LRGQRFAVQHGFAGVRIRDAPSRAREPVSRTGAPSGARTGCCSADGSRRRRPPSPSASAAPPPVTRRPSTAASASRARTKRWTVRAMCGTTKTGTWHIRRGARVCVRIAVDVAGPWYHVAVADVRCAARERAERPLRGVHDAAERRTLRADVHRAGDDGRRVVQQSCRESSALLERLAFGPKILVFPDARRYRRSASTLPDARTNGWLQRRSGFPKFATPAAGMLRRRRFAAALSSAAVTERHEVRAAGADQAACKCGISSSRQRAIQCWAGGLVQCQSMIGPQNRQRWQVLRRAQYQCDVPLRFALIAV